jgi:phage gp16-like protein
LEAPLKPPKWIAVCIVLLAAAAGAEFAVILKLRYDLEAAREKTERLSDRFAEIAFESGNSKGMQSADNSGLKSLELKLVSALRRLDALESQDGRSPNLDEAIDRKLSEKVNHGQTESAMLAGLGQNRGPRFRRTPIDSIVEKLDMTDEQKSKFTDIVQRVKNSMLELSETANNEDPEFVKEINELVRDRSRPRLRSERIKEKLSSKNLPGSDETYLETLTQLRSKAFSELESVLTAEQVQAFKDMRVSIFNIRIDNATEE